MWDPKRLPRVNPMATPLGSAPFGAEARPGPAGAGGDTEYGNDATPAGFFSADFKRHDDLKQMLDSSKDNLKLEAMKRIIGMVAKGRDASDLFPAVVKNVVSKNIEVKKLVYTYLVRYAEEKQDLALLSISTFQRALKDPNQLIRANALRVLSSIRVPVIVPIMMLAINDSVVDMSPYVRKTAAHAIPKLYSLDPDQKEELVTVIEKLLADRTTLVVGSAVMAFEEVCPERIDLVHKNFRKLCNVLVDIEEWGQVIIINMLTHYARTQFVDPNLQEGSGDQPDRPFYEETESEEEEASGSEAGAAKKKPYVMDPDHSLLLRSTKPLLQSRNAAVVMGVAQLYHHLAPRSEVTQVTKAMIRLLRSHREVQSVVLTCIASMTTQRKGMFEPYLKSFFVRSCDSSHIKILKLEILTNLATESSISIVLREFQTYIASHDKTFVAATIQAIGRCASNIADVTDTCLQGLVALLSNRDESVVAESVVVIKKLLQTQPGEHKEIIRHMARLVDTIKIPMARASILWLIGEYCDRIPKIAPDVLRKMAQTFINEEDIVKLQIVNLASKLCLTNPEQTELLTQYVYNLARYDPSYDLRDRVRLMRHLVFPDDGPDSRLGKYARRIFMATKPAPRLESSFKDRDQFQLGSLSHYINARASGYRELPEFPAEAPDPSVRNSVVPLPELPPEPAEPPARQRGFYSDSSSGDGSDDSESDSSSSDSEESSGDTSGQSSSTSDTQPRSKTQGRAPPPSRGVSSLRPPQASSSDSDDSDDDEDEDDGSSSGSDSGSEDGSDSSAAPPPPPPAEAAAAPAPTPPPPAPPATQNSVDLLLNLDAVPAPVGSELLTPSLGGFLSPLTASRPAPAADSIQTVSAAYVPSTYRDLVNHVAGSGLEIKYRYTRTPHLYSGKMTSVELTFTNTTQQEMRDIRVGQKTLAAGLAMHEFAPIALLAPGGTVSSTLGVDFHDSTHAARFDVLGYGGRSVSVSLAAPMGEILRPVTMAPGLFQQKRGQLRGMNEAGGSVPAAGQQEPAAVRRKVQQIANVGCVAADDDGDRVLRFAGQTLSSDTLVLITVTLPSPDAAEGATVGIVVNCEKMVVGNMLLKDLKTQLS